MSDVATPKILDPIAPGEHYTVEFDLDLAEGDSITGTPVVTVTVAFGTDANPNRVKSGAASGTSVKVLQDCLGPADASGIDYHLVASADTADGDHIVSRAAILPVRAR
jgi:hypothetical protein